MTYVGNIVAYADFFALYISLWRQLADERRLVPLAVMVPLTVMVQRR